MTKRTAVLLAPLIGTWLALVQPAAGQVETAILVVNAASTIVGAFRKSGSGGLTSILTAMSENLSQINRGLQTALSELGAIREGQAKLPVNIYDYFSVRAVAGQAQALYELREQGQTSNTDADRYAYYRDLFALYDDVRKARQQVLNESYEVGENLVIHLPLMFMIEQEAYALLTGALTGNASDNALLPFAVSEAAWISALSNYLRFYNMAVDANFTGSFANERRALNQKISGLLEPYSSPSLEALRRYATIERSEFICYYVDSTHEEAYTFPDGMGGSDSNTVIYTTRALYYREYNFNRFEGELTLAARSEKPFGMRIGPTQSVSSLDQQTYNELQRLNEELRIDCNYPVTKEGLIQEDTLSRLDINALQPDIVRRGFLAAIDELDRKTAAMLVEQAAPYDAKIEMSLYPTLTRVAREIGGK
ncbi:hypothetical protein HFO71_31395 [Rhizobium laguerreae]|uniref:hypothetical protein n=1 Tax=Rhizobium laguerreae TaxID=1076926 RepID=UPI001C907BF4|nr:hypothetical protein [Rhizobium laguerreae]MBY3074817.1 hypothetical protein [Rhizobium laguerreae]MBY3088871.1 hypothetical protein [Rhizobium laguerreae]MBY3129606.1 hypothetical protein [Rhizobium laguerreae]